MRTLVKQPDSWVERAPQHATASREVAASASAIWAVLEDHESWPTWFEAVKGVTVTGNATGVGARRRVHLSGLDVDEEFVAWDVDERFAFTAEAMSRGLFTSLNERVTLEPLDTDRTRVSYTQAFAPTWWFRPVFPLAKRQFRRALDAALDNLVARFT